MSSSTIDNPVPTDFDNYLPWACLQFSIPEEIIIIRNKKIVSEATSFHQSQTGTAKNKRGKIEGHSLNDIETNETKVFKQQKVPKRDDQIAIYTTYDIRGNLNELKFDKNVNVPSKVLIIIKLIIKFHTYLTSVVINRGLSHSSLQELSQILVVSNITNLYLDKTILQSGNFAILLEMETKIKHLSLAQCCINDQDLQQITSKFLHTLPASKTVLLLNLASNKITDEGAKFIAEMLRSNRKLVYLNLSDNLLTDKGCLLILEVLDEFILTEEEIKSSRTRRLFFLNKHQELCQIAEHDDQISSKSKKSVKTAIYSGKKAKSQDRNTVDYKDPFAPNNIKVRDNGVYCDGNNILAYLNISYNNISYISVKKLLSVLLNQKAMARKPIGLVKVRLDGNCIPINCVELTQIDSILNSMLGPVSKSKATKPTQSISGLLPK